MCVDGSVIFDISSAGQAVRFIFFAHKRATTALSGGIAGHIKHVMLTKLDTNRKHEGVDAAVEAQTGQGNKKATCLAVGRRTREHKKVLKRLTGQPEPVLQDRPPEPEPGMPPGIHLLLFHFWGEATMMGRHLFPVWSPLWGHQCFEFVLNGAHAGMEMA